MRADCHIHTYTSFDSAITPQDIVRRCRLQNISLVCLVDHNICPNYIVFKRKCSKYGIQIIHGIEYKTKEGDIIGLFMNEKPPKKNSRMIEIIEFIHENSGLIVLPHPIKRHNIDYIIKEIISRVDFVEVFNSRQTFMENIASLRLALSYEKNMLCGSDAHWSWEVGNATVDTKGFDLIVDADDFLEHFNIRNVTALSCRTSARLSEWLSQLFAGIRLFSPEHIRNAVLMLMRDVRLIIKEMYLGAFLSYEINISLIGTPTTKEDIFNNYNFMCSDLT